MQLFLFFFYKVSEAPVDDELVGLLHDIHTNNINGHAYRGYSVLGKSITEVSVSKLYINGKRYGKRINDKWFIGSKSR